MNHYIVSSESLRVVNSLQIVIQKFPRVTSTGSLSPKNLGKSRGPPQNPAETPQNPQRDPAEPSERPPQRPLRGKFPRRASRRVVPLGWWPSGTLESKVTTHTVFSMSGSLVRARERSGKGVVRRNGCPKGCFWRVRLCSSPLKVCSWNTWKP